MKKNYKTKKEPQGWLYWREDTPILNPFILPLYGVGGGKYLDDPLALPTAAL